jgi:PAS domain S-box-containing protein
VAPASRRRSARVAEIPAALDLTVFRQMADMSNEAFYLTDAEGRYLYVNQRASSMSGFSREELLQQSVSQSNPDYPPARWHEFTAAIAQGPLAPFETINRCKDGSIMPIEVSVARLDVEGVPHYFGVVRDISERKQIEAAHKHFTQRLLQTLEAERQRVARELHDDVGQAVATIGVLLHSLGQAEGPLPKELEPTLAATQATIRQITESVARIVRDYHPAELVGLGLEETLRAHARQFAARHGLTLRLATSDVDHAVSVEQELHLFRIVQEALANVAHHARARRVTVRMTRRRSELVVTVRDDGAGFDPARRDYSGFGLVTMRERAALMGAELVVRSQPGHGCQVSVAVPVASTATRRATTARGRTQRRRAMAAKARA